MTLHTRLLVAAGLVWLDSGRILVQRRPEGAPHGAGLLELPGGKIEPGESPMAALERELVEEWGPGAAALCVGRVAEVLHHVYPGPRGPEIVLIIYHVDARVWRDGWEPFVELEPGAGAEAYRLDDLPTDAFLAADRGFVEEVARGEIPAPFA